jgi:uncharacterized membrane protein YGL010W
MAKSNLKPISVKENLRPIEVYFNRLNASHQNPANKLLHFIGIPLVLFGILGIAWAIPFPFIKFLGQYNGMFNWASFVIAFSVYYTLKLSPNLSYTILIILFVLSFGISQLAALETAGGPPLIWVSTAILAVGVLLQYIGGNMEGSKRSFEDDWQLALITPIWLMHFLAKRIGMKY